ncbi:DUF4861 domain-containing protein [Maribellus luteus]|uniref:DUF4861 domain-containing protein n=1 Tax=Maribellus luteus TaxID=2305463 RepID=A0A399SVG7_9BACT|nr:DUF4861 domain-containing protein [Maribellus luteus]RIJ46632.1 DUF4861 domain-containing protein [Maribellus luteus]
MNTKVGWLLLAVVTLLSCKQEHRISFVNPVPEDRSDEVVVLTREQVAAKVEIKEGFLPIFRVGEETLPSQVDDMNGDGKWDEVAVLLSFKANEEKSTVLEMIPENEYPAFEKRTNLRLGVHQEDGAYKEVDHYAAIPATEPFKIIAQGESVSWENDKIAFRVYFDCRNVKDLFGKLKPEMIIDKIHTPEIKDYHSLNDWGMDVLHCGSSLGSGGIALLKNDSLYRLGSTDVYEYQKVSEGPVRSVFDLIYKGWHVDGDNLEATERISIYPGKYWFQSDVTVKGLPEGAQIVTGIVTSLLKREPFAFEANDFECMGTHDVQSLNNDELGMAVLVPKAEAGKIGRTTDINFFKLGYQTVVEKGFSNIISETYYIGQKAEANKPARHYFSAVWGLEKDQWKTEDGFKSYLKEESKVLSSPIEVHF